VIEGPIVFTLLIVLFVALLVLLPALAIYASARIRHLEGEKSRAGQPAAPSPPRNLGTIQDRLESIEDRLAALENRYASPEASPVVAPSASAPSEPSPEPTYSHARRSGAPAEGQTVILPSPRRGQPARSDLESVFAEHWLNYFGIIAILFAAAFFIKYAFDNHWVGPRGRVEVGLLAGALVMLWSDRLMRRGYLYFSEGMAALGVSVLYLSIWGGWHYYRLFGSGAALGAMAAITAAAAALAVGRDSQRLILMALAGGFLSPFLLNAGREHELVLFGYNAVLAAGMIAVERLRRWSWLPLLAFFSIELYFWSWYAVYYSTPRLWPTLAFATLFFLLFAALPTLHGRQSGNLPKPELVVVVANLCCYLGALWMFLRPDHRWVLIFAFLALAAAHWAERRALPEKSATLGRVLGTLALLCATVAVPARLDGRWLTIAWALEGAGVVWAGARIASWRTRAAGTMLLAVIAVRLVVLRIPAHLFLWNARLGTFAAAVGCFAVAASAYRRAAGGIGTAEQDVRRLLLAAVTGCSLFALSLEVWDLFGRLPIAGIEHGAAQQMALSVLWTLFATGLIVLGIVRKSALLRWEALALFALTVGKVFLHDLASLERFYRILSFLILGVLLLVVSFLYQRRAMVHKDASSPARKTG
jgi:uncharacterized membrane protein